MRQNFYGLSTQAEKLASDFVPVNAKPTNSEITEGISRSEAKNADNIKQYENLVDKLCSELETRKLHWRHYNLGMVILIVKLLASVQHCGNWGYEKSEPQK